MASSTLGISRQAGVDRRKQRKDKRPMRNLLKQDVMYLMVLNIPTKEKQDSVLTELERANQYGNGRSQDGLQYVP